MLGIRSHGCLIMSGWHVCRLGPLTDLCRLSGSMLYLQFLLSLDFGYVEQTNKKLLAQLLRMELRVPVPVKAADHSFFSCDNSCALPLFSSRNLDFGSTVASSFLFGK